MLRYVFCSHTASRQKKPKIYIHKGWNENMSLKKAITAINEDERSNEKEMETEENTI